MPNKTSIIIKSIIDFLSCKRNINFYFATIDLFDSLLAILYSTCILLRLPIAYRGRENFQKKVKRLLGEREVFFYGSARSALYALLKSIEFEPGSEVILTGFTCDVVPNAVIQAGLQPVFADITPSTFCLSPESVKQRITSRTSALIIQHTFGVPADIDALLDIARQHDLYVIEDCAVSLGSRYKGKLTGIFGDASIFSFELSKIITSCRGGMLFVNTNKRQGIARHRAFYKAVPEQSMEYASNILFQLGMSGILYRPIIYNLGKYISSFMFKMGFFKQSTPFPETQAKISDNYMLKLSNQQASLLCRQWKKLDRICKNSQKISSNYYENLKNTTGVKALPIKKNENLNLVRYPILFDHREELIRVFQNTGIELGMWFTAPISSPDINAELFGYAHGECPNAEEIADKICNLPTHLKVTTRDIIKIIQLFRTIEFENV